VRHCYLASTLTMRNFLKWLDHYIKAQVSYLQFPTMSLIQSHLKNGILVKDQGGTEFQSEGILKYSYELK